MTTTETPTTTQTPGCCKGTNRNSNDACNAIEDPDQCDRRSSCTFIAFGNIAVDCAFPPTEPPSEPGCCYGNPDIAYSKRWMEECKKFGTEEECLMLTNGDGEPRCYFEPLGEYEDCETVWPTTTETPTEPAGCCHGDSYKSNDKCRKMDDDCARCEKQGCTFLETDDPSDCDVTTTETPTTTAEVGCCRGDSAKTNDMCNSRLTREQCERSSSCHFIVDGDVDDECQFPPTEEPEEPGCCYVNPAGAYSKRWQDTCTGYFTERECLFNVDDSGMTRCVFEPMNEYMDCEALWPTTTETPTDPAGCCYDGDSYKANSKCARATSQSKCEDMGCSFLVTDDYTDCDMTTTETPTTTEEPGCCKADSKKREDMCLARVTRDQCEKSSSCIGWISGKDADCSFPQTTTEEPGCCYINPDQAYSKKYQDTCITFGTERECLKLTDGNGEPRCVFEEMNEYMDCSAVWPTTTTTTIEPGCCKGSSYKAQAKCFGLADQKSCERKSCEWVVTDDEDDCVITTTDSPTTTITPGCCAHTSLRPNDKCNDIEDEDQCNR